MLVSGLVGVSCVFTPVINTGVDCLGALCFYYLLVLLSLCLPFGSFRTIFVGF